ncbi:tryptophan--tRNA ligase [Alkalihalobacterium bogoriense]|uniref:tryptophan--tRNA ligase n=1 Tax=Alkalihalobacterium bogoriense TaxID=246272 RepID=UPI00055887B6|nr:tryptophan--tRNA ligase [Alkalihalobacterium bogoriense]
MVKQTVLTGIKATGELHLGNYIGAIKPALQIAKHENVNPMYFIADYHALTKVHEQQTLQEYSYGIAAAWLALGLNPKRCLFYRQSDIPEIFELVWILSCFSSKGLMNRAHAYKAIKEQNIDQGYDKDDGVNMGIFSYPILMAADILLFQAKEVPVGRDQIQHIEIARDIATSFNSQYGNVFTLPQSRVSEQAVLPGLDGRKMSKSYGNTIPLFAQKDIMKKLINKIMTDSSKPNERKDPDQSTIFTIYKEFATNEQTEKMRQQFYDGISWGEAKQELFSIVSETLEEPRVIYNEFMTDKAQLDRILQEGAERARDIAVPFLKEVKKTIGL